jgi:hypothetical protein
VEIGIAQIGFGEIGADETGAAEVGPAQIGPGERRPVENAAGKILAGEVQTAEVAVFEALAGAVRQSLRTRMERGGGRRRGRGPLLLSLLAPPSPPALAPGIGVIRKRGAGNRRRAQERGDRAAARRQRAKTAREVVK